MWMAWIGLIAQNLFSSQHRMLSVTMKDEHVDTFLNANFIITIRIQIERCKRCNTRTHTHFTKFYVLMDFRSAKNATNNNQINEMINDADFNDANSNEHCVPSRRPKLDEFSLVFFSAAVWLMKLGTWMIKNIFYLLFSLDAHGSSAKSKES